MSTGGCASVSLVLSGWPEYIPTILLSARRWIECPPLYIILARVGEFCSLNYYYKTRKLCGWERRCTRDLWLMAISMQSLPCNCTFSIVIVYLSKLRTPHSSRVLFLSCESEWSPPPPLKSSSSVGRSFGDHRQFWGALVLDRRRTAVSVS